MGTLATPLVLAEKNPVKLFTRRVGDLWRHGAFHPCFDMAPFNILPTYFAQIPEMQSWKIYATR